MKFTEGVSTEGYITLILEKEDGAVYKNTYKNLVVDTGKNLLAKALVQAITPLSFMAIGTGTNPVTVSDTTLQTEVARNSITSSTIIANTTSVTCIFGPGVGTGTLTEAGIFNASLGGSMYNRAVFPAQAKAAGDTLSVIWGLTVN